MARQTRSILIIALAVFALLGAGGYLWYRNSVSESDADLQRQRENMYPTGGQAVHPGQQKK